MPTESDVKEITIEEFLQYPEPQFEFAVFNLMAMRSMKQIVLFDQTHRYKRNTPELAEARLILESAHRKLLLDVWNTHPEHGAYVWAEREGMWVKCETLMDGTREIVVASDTNPTPMVAFRYTLPAKER